MQVAGRNIEALAWLATAFCVIAAFPSARPQPTLVYLLLSASLVVGAMLGVRLAPGRLPTPLVLVPATVAAVRLGEAALPAILCATLLAGLVRSRHVFDSFRLAGSETVVFGAALLLARGVGEGFAHALAFAASYAGLRTFVAVARARILREPGWRELADLPLLLLLSPLALFPLLIGLAIGDGGLVLALAALLLLLLVVQDAVNLATARLEVERDRDRLARAYALQEDVVQLVTHDVNNALTAVLAYTQLQRRALDSGSLDRASEYLTRVERGGATIQRLIQTLVKLARLEQSESLPPPAPVTIMPVLEQALAEHRPLAQDRKQQLKLEPASRDLAALAQADLLGEAVSNLVGNAVKYTPDGGAISLGAHRDAGRIVISVSDTGIGMDAEDVRRLFTRFFRGSDPAARRQPGIGLGLALVRSIVERMGGEVRVESKRGRGTTFQIVLPAGVV